MRASPLSLPGVAEASSISGLPASGCSYLLFQHHIPMVVEITSLSRRERDAEVFLHDIPFHPHRIWQLAAKN